MSLSHEYLGGKYSVDQLDKIIAMNRRERGTQKPNVAFYRKSAGEFGPTWNDRRELVEYLANDSNITPLSKVYLRECEEWIPRYQYRGFKYGLVTMSATYLFFPLVRKQPFVKRALISTLPMIYFMKWGYTWGHENFWRRAKEVVVTYEMFAGTRSKFTMK